MPPHAADWRSLMASSVRVLASGHHLCLICDKTNKQRGSMQRHMREIHAKGPFIKDVRTEGGGGVDPKAVIVREVA